MCRRKNASFLASVVIAGFGSSFAVHASENGGQYSEADIILSAVNESSSDNIDDIDFCKKYGDPDFYEKRLSNNRDKTYIDPVKISESNKELSSGEILDSQSFGPSKEDKDVISPNLADTPGLNGEIKKRDSSKKNKKSSKKKKSKKIGTNKNTRLAKKYGDLRFDDSKLHVNPSKISSEKGDKILEENAGTKGRDNDEVKEKNTSAVLPSAANVSNLDGNTKSSVPSLTEVGDPSAEKKKKSPRKSAPKVDFSKESIIGTGVALGGAAGALYLSSILKRKVYSEEKKADDIYSENSENTDVGDPSNKNINTENSSNEHSDDQNAGEKKETKDENSGGDEKELTKDEGVGEENSFGLYVVFTFELVIMAGLFFAVYKLHANSNLNDGGGDAAPHANMNEV